MQFSLADERVYDPPHYAFQIGDAGKDIPVLVRVHHYGFHNAKEQWYLQCIISKNNQSQIPIKVVGPLWEVETKFKKLECLFDSFKDAYKALIELARKYNLQEIL